MLLEHSKRLVIKIGSALLVDEENKRINTEWLLSLIDDIVELAQAGKEVVIVSSGAGALGKITLGLDPKRATLEKLQAAAAVGQIQLSHTYQNLLQQCGFTAAQILLGLTDSENRRRFLNSRNTLETLLAMKVIPIINENDTVATAEIRYGDNDRLAGRVAQMINADTLILLSDIDGLYTADPKLDRNATLLPVVNELTPEILAMAGDSGTKHGSGGMITKLAAAQIALSSGCRMLITLGKQQHPIKQFIKTQRGTWFLPKTNALTAKKAWLKEHLQPAGRVTIDAGAAKALADGKSLLPVGITASHGQFQKGDPLSVMDEDGKEVARGLSNYSNTEVAKIKRCASNEIADLLGYNGCHEVIHRDNMVLL